MNYREVVIFNGKRFQVPHYIQRIDVGRTHSWQVRYSKPWVSFSDHSKDGRGAKSSLEEATAELIRQMSVLPAASGLRQKAKSGKTTELPVGLSGPYERQRKGKAYSEFVIQVSIPRYPEGSTSKSVYIGTNNTIDERRIRNAIKKAVLMRKEAEDRYELAKTACRQKDARELQRRRNK